MFKNKTFIILSISFLIILFIELLFYMSWKISKLKYFENINNYNERLVKTTDIAFIKKSKTQKIKEYKIALFGGSNLKGFGSPLNVEEILRNKNFLHNNKFLVNNFANYGRTFSGYQYKIFKKVINKYDIFFIYAGHNEYKMINSLDAFKNEYIKFFPNGSPIGAKRYLEPSDLELNKVIKDTRKDYTFKENFFLFFKNNSRIYFFSIRVNDRLNLFRFIKKAKKNENFALKKFSHKIDYFDSNTRLNIINLYENNLMDLLKNLNTNQKIIISTLASNDFFSPLGDSNLLEVDEAKYESIYKNLNNDLNFSKISTEDLPDGSNKYYILGMQCLEVYGYVYDQSIKCYELLLNARRLDNIPTRVFPKLNEFIRSLKNNSQITVIDLEIEILKRIKTKSDYLSFFVDFHHLSPKGHLLLANLLLHEIDKSIDIINIDEIKIDKCGNTQKIDVNKNFESDLIIVPYNRCKWPLISINRMLKSHLKYYKKTVFYDHYMNLAQ